MHNQNIKINIEKFLNYLSGQGVNVHILARSHGAIVAGRHAPIESIRRLLRDPNPGFPQNWTALDICLTGNHRRIPFADIDQAFHRESDGTRGFSIHTKNGIRWFTSNRIISENISAKKIIECEIRKLGGEVADFVAHGGEVYQFDNQCFLFDLRSGQTTSLTRGSLPILKKDVDEALLKSMATELCQWMIVNQSVDGSIPYKFFPSKSKISSSNNTVRQFLATLSLIKASNFFGAEDIRKAAVHNLQANLRSFFSDRGSYGVISFNGTAKLGAAALAALSILELEGENGEHCEIFAKLVRGIELLWSQSGSFRTFYYPEDRNDNQNFYPGEALVFWATLWEKTREQALLEKILSTYRFYQSWHRENRNPAFVPWHTQACAIVYRNLKLKELASWIFEMNDWLLGMQVPCVAHPDLAGQFYNSEHPEFGPPHASSTAVYLEGLSDAMEIARHCGDTMRAVQYQSSIKDGLRSLRQLQFKVAAEAFYVPQPHRVLGGIRTNPYDNTIRIDNVQHSLMATLKLIKTRLFEEENPP